MLDKQRTMLLDTATAKRDDLFDAMRKELKERPASLVARDRNEYLNRLNEIIELGLAIDALYRVDRF